MDPVEVVRRFMDVVRSGADPDAAERYMAPEITSNLVQSENPAVVVRTPAQYAEHVREMIAAYGEFTITVDELFGAGDKVYVRWSQHGHHVGPVGGQAPTGAAVTQLTSAVYRVQNGKIAEYWIQIDRAGLHTQLRAAATS